MKTAKINVTSSANATPEVIAAWKKENPRGVWILTVFKDDEEDTDPDAVAESKTGYVRKPTRQELSAAMTLKNDPLGQAENILRDCWLGGDEELLEDEDYFQGAVSKFSEIMEVRKAEIKKL